MELKTKYDLIIKSIKASGLPDRTGEFVYYFCPYCKKGEMFYYSSNGYAPLLVKCECGGYLCVKRPNALRVINYRRFYRPSFDEFLKLSKKAQNHILYGGLIVEKENNKLNYEK